MQKITVVLCFVLYISNIHAYEVTIVNNTDFSYKKATIVLRVSNCNMAYGRYDTKTAILPHKTINEKVANQYLQVPFSGGGLSNGVYNDTDGPESCNMHATVILDPEAERPIQTISADCVLSSPRKIITDSTTFPYASQPLVGLEPPNITITINGTKSTDLDISFN